VAYSGGEYSNPKSSVLAERKESGEESLGRATLGCKNFSKNTFGEAPFGGKVRSHKRNQLSHTNDPSVLDPSIRNPAADSAMAENT